MSDILTGDTGVGDATRARLTFDLDADICVVGAGLAGLTVALEAARLGASVVVLEGRHVGWGASGGLLGTVMPGYGLALKDLIARIGLEDAKELWDLSKQGAEYVRAQATEQQMPGIAVSEGALQVSNVDVGDRLISELQMLGEDFGTEVEGWQIDQVRAQHQIFYVFDWDEHALRAVQSFDAADVEETFDFLIHTTDGLDDAALIYRAGDRNILAQGQIS